MSNTPPKARNDADWANPIVCWSKMQAESGQDIRCIIARKELERRAGDGTFFWGVGNAPGATPARLAREEVPVEAIFSLMRSRPKARDASARDVEVWRGYIDQFGRERELPAGALVTSRADAEGSSRRSHYALVCRSEVPLALDDLGGFNPREYRNVGGRGAPVGASQVTALLRLTDRVAGVEAAYRVNLRAMLIGGYWVKLTDRTRLGVAQARLLLDRLTDVSHVRLADWIDLVAEFRGRFRPSATQPCLFGKSDDAFASAGATI